jgi:very-short-patch-repair endonuclease
MFSRARELRRQMSLPEIVLWQALRKGRLAGLRFRRQHPIGPYILDFYCASARLAIEVDGSAHDTAVAARHDEIRQAWLAGRAVTVLRFSAGDVLQDEKLQAVLKAIERALPQPPSGALHAPPPQQGGGGSSLAPE